MVQIKGGGGLLGQGTAGVRHEDQEGDRGLGSRDHGAERAQVPIVERRRLALRLKAMRTWVPRTCASSEKQVRCPCWLVAWNLERYAWHTQTVNLYAPLILPVGHTRGETYNHLIL